MLDVKQLDNTEADVLSGLLCSEYWAIRVRSVSADTHINDRKRDADRMPAIESMMEQLDELGTWSKQ